GIDISVTSSARLWLGDRGYDPQYGARPLKRVIQQEIHNALAMVLLNGRFGDGDVIAIDLDPVADALTFTAVKDDALTG
ncbi:MAG: ATP-dependent chaperone ClpB, partial [Alphaproteobacteria bacterium]|nr:ATP-dependent chaperone ClpB [Alphaproteobacteria bacterium]